MGAPVYRGLGYGGGCLTPRTTVHLCAYIHQIPHTLKGHGDSPRKTPSWPSLLIRALFCCSDPAAYGSNGRGPNVLLKYIHSYNSGTGVLKKDMPLRTEMSWIPVSGVQPDEVDLMCDEGWKTGRISFVVRLCPGGCIEGSKDKVANP